jgi:hypothetical protein
VHTYFESSLKRKKRIAKHIEVGKLTKKIRSRSYLRDVTVFLEVTVFVAPIGGNLNSQKMLQNKAAIAGINSSIIEFT